MFVCSFVFVPSLPSCHEKVMVVLYIRQNLTRVGVADTFSVDSLSFSQLIYCLFKDTKQR